MSRVRRDHPRCRSATRICMCSHTRELVIYSRFHQNPFRGYGATGLTLFKQGRRHGFQSGGTKRDSRAKGAKKNFFTPTFGKVGGTIFYTWGYEQGNKYHYHH